MNPTSTPKKTVLPHHCKNHSVRFADAHWGQVVIAAARFTEGALSPGRLWWSSAPAKPLTWVASVALDWARYVNALPAGAPVRLPSELMKSQAERIAQLEALLRAAGIDPGAPAQAGTRKRGRAANG